MANRRRPRNSCSCLGQHSIFDYCEFPAHKYPLTQQIARDISDALVKACELLHCIISALVRFSAYLNLFQERPVLLTFILAFYEKVLEFSVEAIRMYSRNAIRKLKLETFAAYLN